MWWVAMSLVLVAGLLAAVLSTISSGARRVARATSGHGGAATNRVRAVALPGPFIPEQVVSAARRIWVVGSAQPTDLQCELEEIDPTTLHTSTFALPECAPYVAVGDGHIFLSADTFTRATDSDAFRIESFDTATGETTVLAPVDVATSGTGYAHMAMAYGGGSLWLYPWGDEAL